MRCYYEVLEVERQATNDDIKRAYKKLALKWHPDKNIGRQEEATERFKEISQAFNVLSDKQERQWYDDHREDILRGGDGTGGADEVIINIWPFFSSSCYDGYEGPGGFYAVYADLFRRIDELEQSRCSKSHDEHESVSFGDENIAEPDLRAFYNHWENFVTCMNFSWADQYVLSEAPNRAYRRAMDAENKKARDKARKEWQETIGALVTHVKKRDRRMMHFETHRQEQLRQRKEEQAAQKAREKAERKQLLEAQRERWRQQAEEFENERNGAFLLADEDEKEESEYLYADEEDDYSEFPEDGFAEANDDDDHVEKEKAEDEETFHCDICEKTFQKEEQYKQHVNSRAHRAKKAELEKKAKKTKSQMPRPQSESKDDTTSTTSTAATAATKPIETDEEVAAMTELSLTEERSDKKSKKKKNAQVADADSTDGTPLCRVCGETFGSRSKLFQHLESSGHATTITAAPVSASANGSRKGKKGKKK